MSRVPMPDRTLSILCLFPIPSVRCQAESPETHDSLHTVRRSSTSDGFSTVDLNSSTSDISLESTERPEISDALRSDTSSQADNVKLSALQKQLDIELKVKHGAENLVKAYSNDPPKVKMIAVLLITVYNTQYLHYIMSQPLQNNHRYQLRRRTLTLLPLRCWDFPIFSMKPIVLPDLEHDLEMPPAPSQTFLDNIQHDISVYIEFPDFLAQDYGEGHKYIIDNKHITTNPTADVIREPDRTDSPLDNSVREPSKTSKDVRIRPRIPLTMEDFKLRSVLGRGSFGKVLLAKYKNTNKMYALKVMRKGDIESSPMLDSLLCEKRVFQAVTNKRYPFLINLFGCFHTQDHIIFAMEYAAGGDLSTLLNNKRRPFPESRAIFFSACVVLGLDFLHEQKIIHRDLKLENIVLDDKGFAKITDFGLCKEGIGYGDTTGSPRGTPHYVAPEVCKRKPYTRAVDWWSFGVVIYVMLSGKLLTKKVKERLGASKKDAQDVKEHPFFEQIDWAALLLKNVRPPFLPDIRGAEDVRNFSSAFTSEYPMLTPPKKRAEIPCYEAEAFEDFNWRLQISQSHHTRSSPDSRVVPTHSSTSEQVGPHREESTTRSIYS
ncbi:serine threonine- kinase N2 [Pelobates cultripes]|uniref:Serine threonine- kinase N2 n=1 Tax=Pelobates cultripes TaxID=61616 RepID=A0AAD1R8X8_PELCU|nr:serine threonine- kinase N2 [Pelobates cultripes]